MTEALRWILEDFRLLHQSMLDAVTPEASADDYYAHRQEREDGGYLHATGQKLPGRIAQFPRYRQLCSVMCRNLSDCIVICRYTSISHIAERERRFKPGGNEHKRRIRIYRWNEFAAATGSTLGHVYVVSGGCRVQIWTEEAAKHQSGLFSRQYAAFIFYWIT